MAERIKLRYHEATFRLLGEEPVLSPTAVGEIEAAERRCGRRLPLSVREWYSLEGVDTRLHEPVHRRRNVFCSVRQVLRWFEAWPQPHSWEEQYVLVRTEDISHAFLPDGSDDPPIYVDHDDGVWQFSQAHFTEFVFGWALYKKTRPYVLTKSEDARICLQAADSSFGPMELDFLKENYDEGPVCACHPNPRFHCFFSTDTWIHVSASLQPYTLEPFWSWQIIAASEEALYQAARKVWPCSTLAQTLVAYGAAGWSVLARLRQEFGRERRRGPS
jgi:hypothetical protein